MKRIDGQRIKESYRSTLVAINDLMAVKSTNQNTFCHGRPLKIELFYGRTAKLNFYSIFASNENVRTSSPHLRDVNKAMDFQNKTIP